MAAIERLGNLGYLGLAKETTKGVAVTPTDFVDLYEESLSTELNLIRQQPIRGSKAAVQNVLQGQRSHKGDVTIACEPNTMARMFDMLLTKTSTTGAGPYTHIFGLSGTTNPNSYTIDVSYVNMVVRYFGVEASKFSPLWNSNEMQAKFSLSALGSFQGREIASVSTTTITLKTDYDPTPNKGLVTGDLVRIYKSSTGATLDTTVSSVNVDGITVVLGATAAAFAAGDFIYLRPATVSQNLLPNFLWAKTFFVPSTTAALALAANPQTAQLRVEQGSTYEIMHDFESDDGSDRSGSFDPASLVRLTGDYNFSLKRFFDTTEDVQNFNNLAKSAWQIRHQAGSTNQYELRFTFNHVKTSGKPVADAKASDVNYSDIKFIGTNDSTDAQMFAVTVINGLSTI